MQFFFIRHGQSANNALWEATGSNEGRSIDPELTETGHQQAKLLAEWIVRMDAEDHPGAHDGWIPRDYFHFTHLYTSLMIRSVETSSYVAKRLGLKLHAWPDFHETGGIYQDGEEEGVRIGLPGHPRSYFIKRYQHLVLTDEINEAGWWNRPFEVREERPARAKRVLESLLARHGGADDRVAVVSHGAFYNELIRAMYQTTHHEFWHEMFNTGISRFDFSPEGGIRLIFHNRTEHLPESLIT
jgi:2,3-bisphosphoglycerate-dependent phosphoglycerate mutase